MQLKQILDPRGPLDRVNRDQMREYAEKNGISEITWDMTGDEMRYLLRKRGVTDIGVPHRILGTQADLMIKADNTPGVPTISLEEEQRRQFEQRAREREEALSRRFVGTEKTRAELAKECKKRGIKMQRTDTKEKLIERLNGQSHAA